MITDLNASSMHYCSLRSSLFPRNCFILPSILYNPFPCQTEKFCVWFYIMIFVSLYYEYIFICMFFLVKGVGWICYWNKWNNQKFSSRGYVFCRKSVINIVYHFCYFLHKIYKNNFPVLSYLSCFCVPSTLYITVLNTQAHFTFRDFYSIFLHSSY